MSNNQTTLLFARINKFFKGVGFLLIDLFSMSFLLLVRLTDKIVCKISRWRFFPKFLFKLGPPLRKFTGRVFHHDRTKDPNISKVALIDMALKNMVFKKSRSIITIGGMSIGIGAIVFLVSIGYGVQQLVVNSVARLEELRQADVTKQPGSQLKITDETIASIKNSPLVEYALPLIAVVGRINFQNSVTDMAVYGVTSEYLKQSAIQPTQGNIFKSDDQSLAQKTSLTAGKVAGATTVNEAADAEVGDVISQVFVQMEPGSWYRVRSAPTRSGTILGYTKREEGQQLVSLVWGDKYEGGEKFFGTNSEGVELARWLQGSFLLWEKDNCSVGEEDCEPGGYRISRDENGKQIQSSGYFAQMELLVEKVANPGQVLGTSIDINDLVKMGVASSGAELGIAQLASESALMQASVDKVDLGSQAVKEVVINTAGLTALGIEPQAAVGSEFTITFVVPTELLEDESRKIESQPATYRIIGVVPDNNTPYLYVPFIDLRTLGITNYSQLKIVTNDEGSLQNVRDLTESMGFITVSVVDTIEQIDNLFASIRLVLAALGLIALVVAALGMFNTLTVSLLERTREVGLLKAIGMKSAEVRRLFITESLIMGFFGGIGGIIIGFLAGKVVSIMISGLSFSTHAQWIDVTYIPPSFSALVFGLSLLVGIVTGLYPARRSKKISALDALRYE